MKHIHLRTHEVQNIIAGRQTRLSRPVKPQPEDGLHNDDQFPRSIDSRLTGWNGTVMETGESKQFKCPFGKVGDVIACKETWRKYHPVDEHRYVEFEKDIIEYAADCPEMIVETDGDGFQVFNKDGTERYIPWRSSATMPLSACRLFLRVKEIRCERIQDITEEGAKAEGVEQNRDGSWHDYLEPARLWQDCAKASYQSLHMKTCGPDSWGLNLWHWVIIFEKTDKPPQP